MRQLAAAKVYMCGMLLTIFLYMLYHRMERIRVAVIVELSKSSFFFFFFVQAVDVWNLKHLYRV